MFLGLREMNVKEMAELREEVAEKLLTLPLHS